jgi:hypothetical protein
VRDFEDVRIVFLLGGIWRGEKGAGRDLASRKFKGGLWVEPKGKAYLWPLTLNEMKLQRGTYFRKEVGFVERGEGTS